MIIWREKEEICVYACVATANGGMWNVTRSYKIDFLIACLGLLHWHMCLYWIKSILNGMHIVRWEKIIFTSYSTFACLFLDICSHAAHILMFYLMLYDLCESIDSFGREDSRVYWAISYTRMVTILFAFKTLLSQVLVTFLS